MFCRAHEQESEVIKEVPTKYRCASGQWVNVNKSSMFFSTNTAEEKRQECMQKSAGIY